MLVESLAFLKAYLRGGDMRAVNGPMWSRKGEEMLCNADVHCVSWIGTANDSVRWTWRAHECKLRILPRRPWRTRQHGWRECFGLSRGQAHPAVSIWHGLNKP